MSLLDRALCALIPVAILAATSADAQPPGGGPPPAPVRVAVVERIALSPTAMVPGTVASRDNAQISAEVTGRLTQVAEVGTAVSEGDVVARIDDTQLRLQQAEFTAGVTRARSQLEFLTREAARLESLLADNVAARSQYERTVNDRDVARSDLAIQRARLGQVEDQLERTRIRSPFNGVVAERFRQAGERVAIGDTVVRVTAPGNLEIVLRAPLASIPFLSEGASVRVDRGATTGIATVRSLVPFGDARSHLFEIRLDPPEGGDWKPGQAVRVAVPVSGQREVLAVPADALILRRDGVSVYRIDAGGQAERIEVVPGAADGTKIEVTGALQPGDRVVIRGGERLRPGQSVTILE